MRLIVVAQNIFIGFWLGRYVAALQGATHIKKIVYVSSLTQAVCLRMFLRKYHVAVHVCDRKAEGSHPLSEEDIASCIELKRGVFKANKLVKKCNELIKFIDANDLFVVFNDSCWPSVALEAVRVDKDRMCVIENANYRSGFAVVSRSTLIDQLFFIPNNCSIFAPVGKLWRIGLKFVSSVNTLVMGRKLYFVHRLFVRSFNIFTFSLLRYFSYYRESKLEPPMVLLQISQDSAIRKRLTETDYIRLMINHLISNEYSCVRLRPHPKDYTFGWIRIWWGLKRAGIRCSISLEPFHKLVDRPIRLIITYSSNSIRFVQSDTDIVLLGSRPPLHGVPLDKLEVMFPGVLG